MSFDPDKDIPPLDGKVIIVTGGSSGLGKESVHQLVKHNPEKIYVTARTAARGNAAITEIEQAYPAAKGKLEFLEMDLGSFASIKQAAETFKARSPRLDILLNNAGLLASASGKTVDGYELQFGSNYLGPALFTELLLPTLRATAQQTGNKPRIVSLSSELFKMAPKEGVVLSKVQTPMEETSTVARYGQSKLAEAYHTRIMAEKYPDCTTIALHPGVVNTGIFDELKKKRPYLGFFIGIAGSLFLTDVHAGAKAQLWASTTADSNLRSGGLYNPKLKEYTESVLKNDKLANELWDWTERQFAEKGIGKLA